MKALTRPQTLREHISKFHPQSSTVEPEKEKGTIFTNSPSQTGSAMENPQSPTEEPVKRKGTKRDHVITPSDIEHTFTNQQSAIEESLIKNKGKEKGKGKGKKSVPVISPSDSGPALTNQQSSIVKQNSPTQIPFNNINIEAKDDNEILKEKDDTLPEILKEQKIIVMGQDGGNVSNPAIPHQMRTPNDQQYSVQIQNDEKMYIDPNELDFWLEKLA